MNQRRNRGFTLVEVIITLAVSGIIFPVLANIISQFTFVPVRLGGTLAASSDLNFVQEWLFSDLNLGPSGNNPTQPRYALVTIGSSQGYDGNNAITIAYDTWETSGSTVQVHRTIVYQLEQLDPNSPDIQLVRRDDAGRTFVVAHHIANASDVVFSKSAESGGGEQMSPGFTMSITSTVEGVSRSTSIRFSMPRTYRFPQPPPEPAAVTWNVDLPSYLPPWRGYWYVITTAAPGNVSAEWKTSGSANLNVYIYNGAPLGTPAGDGLRLPGLVDASIVASNSATTSDLAVNTNSPQAAGTYTVYFFNTSTEYVNTTLATITYLSS